MHDIVLPAGRYRRDQERVRLPGEPRFRSGAMRGVPAGSGPDHRLGCRRLLRLLQGTGHGLSCSQVEAIRGHHRLHPLMVSDSWAPQ
jgi:hypothetical protein